MRGPYFDATTGSRLEQWLATDPHERKLLLRYFVECALPTDTSVRLKVDGATEIIGRGVGNLGPSLRRGRMSVADQEKVSACLLARTNATGKKVELDLLGRDPGFEKPSDPAVFSVREAAYYGNLFADPNEAFVWLPSRIVPRPCTSAGDCGVLQPVGINARLMFAPTRKALDRQGECFVTGSEARGSMDRGQLRYGNEKLVPFAYCENAISGKRYVHVITVLIKRGVAPTIGD